MLTRAPYDELRQSFRWSLPDQLNMAEQACDRWANEDPNRSAIIDLTGPRRDVSFAELRALADSLAHDLVARGVERGDRVGVLRSQSVWCAAAHLAIWKVGAISIPLFKLFREEALTSRVRDAGAKFIVTDAEGVGMLKPLPEITPLVPEYMALPQKAFETAVTGPDDPATLIYTSGTTGSPKGALHGHRVLTGHLPGMQISHDFLDHPDDCLWTPADWAWIGGLFNIPGRWPVSTR
ncbi:MAG: AMP-binding protein [Pseudomonadota bacterium]